MLYSPAAIATELAARFSRNTCGPVLARPVVNGNAHGFKVDRLLNANRTSRFIDRTSS